MNSCNNFYSKCVILNVTVKTITNIFEAICLILNVLLFQVLKNICNSDFAILGYLSELIHEIEVKPSR